MESDFRLGHVLTKKLAVLLIIEPVALPAG